MAPPSLSPANKKKRGNTNASGGSSRFTSFSLVVGIPMLFLAVFTLRSENKMLRIVNSSLQMDIMERSGAATAVTSSPATLTSSSSSSSTTEWTLSTSARPGDLSLPQGTTVLTPTSTLADEMQRLNQHVFFSNLTRGEFQTDALRAAADPLLPSWILDITPDHELKIFSQFGEDGITQYILKHMPTTDTDTNAAAVHKTFVEFGVETGVECNTRILRELHNWTGIMLDGSNDIPNIGLHQEMIHPDNIVSLFEKYNVQKDFGYFSEDTDYSDYFIWRNILEAGYRPRILISETNSNFFNDESVTVHHPGRGNIRMWKYPFDYFGVSPLALKRLWNKHGYLMIYCTKEQVNCFGLHQDDILPPAKRNPAGLKKAQEALWNKPLTWPVKLHACDPDLETYLYVDEDGQVTDQEYSPRVTEYCKSQFAMLESIAQRPPPPKEDFKQFQDPELGTGLFNDKADRAECLPMIPGWILDMNPRIERKIFSQYGEDGVTAFILDRLPAPAVPHTFVEFGVETGIECNTRFLREMHNWTGLMLDGGTDNPPIGLHQEMIHPDNIVGLFEKYGVKKEFGIFSEDTDYSDYFIWRNILEAGYRPRVLISEINSNLFPDESVTVHDPGANIRMWGIGNDYYGLSALALKRLWNKHGYLMVYCTEEQINCFGLHQDDVLPAAYRNPEGLKAAQECLWKKPLTWPIKLHSCDPNHEKWVHVDEEGRATDQEVTPRVVEYCEWANPVG